MRHNLANIRFTELTPHRAAVSSYFTVFTEIGLDHYGRYRDALVPVGAQPARALADRAPVCLDGLDGAELHHGWLGHAIRTCPRPAT